MWGTQGKEPGEMKLEIDGGRAAKDLVCQAEGPGRCADNAGTQQVFSSGKGPKQVAHGGAEWRVALRGQAEGRKTRWNGPGETW